MSRPRIWFPVTKTCENPACGKSFRAESRYAIQYQRFCDRACRSAVIGNGRSVKKIKRKCRQCGAPMLVWPCRKDTKFFDSNVCRGAWAREHGLKAGENNPAWKGGTGNRGAYWKQKARERDKFMCQFPGCKKRDTGPGMHAHHKVPRAAGGSDTMQNLTTLCGRHHHEMERQLLVALVKKYPEATRRIAQRLFQFR